MSRVRLPRSRIALQPGLECPVVQAPMAGVSGAEPCAAVSEAGSLDMLSCGMPSTEQIATALSEVRRQPGGGPQRRGGGAQSEQPSAVVAWLQNV